jgi:hypothetical protein
VIDKNIKPFIQYAALESDGSFAHIFGSKVQAKMCDTPLPIVKIEMTPSDEGGYWGWLQANGEVSMIWPSFVRLAMCFSGGIDSSEALGLGVRIQLDARQVD